MPRDFANTKYPEAKSLPVLENGDLYKQTKTKQQQQQQQNIYKTGGNTQPLTSSLNKGSPSSEVHGQQDAEITYS